MQFLSKLMPKSSVNLLNPDDAEVNRRGEITPAQNTRLNAMSLGGQGFGTIIWPLVILGFIFFIIFSSSLDSGGLNFYALIPIAFLVIVILGYSKGIYRWWRNSTNLKADRANGIVRSGVGELNFVPKKGFIALVGGEELILSGSNDASGLLPGVRYNIYYLPESRFVLSAEQLGEISSGQVRLSLTTILAQANGFTPEELQSNQNGEITQSQRMAGLKKLVPGLILMGFAFVFGIIIIYPLLANSNLKSNYIPLIFVGAFLAIFASIGFSMVLNAFLDFNTSTPEVVEGVGQKISRRKSSGRSSRTVYYYIISGVEFEVPQKAFPALLEGFSYKAYYMPRTKRLLTIEPISIPELKGYDADR
jgi:hypothetical protein